MDEITENEMLKYELPSVTPLSFECFLGGGGQGVTPVTSAYLTKAQMIKTRGQDLPLEWYAHLEWASGACLESIC